MTLLAFGYFSDSFTASGIAATIYFHSVSTIGETHPIEESESMKHLPPLLEREEKEDMEEKEDDAVESRPTLLQISVSDLPTDSAALAKLFNVDNKFIFEGGKYSHSNYLYVRYLTAIFVFYLAIFSLQNWSQKNLPPISCTRRDIYGCVHPPDLCTGINYPPLS